MSDSSTCKGSKLGLLKQAEMKNRKLVSERSNWLNFCSCGFTHDDSCAFCCSLRNLRA